MGESNLLSKLYSKKFSKYRLVNSRTRTIKNRIIASKRDKNFFDGKRNNGYGGYKYDGRWSIVADAIIKKYKLTNQSSVLHINCEKGYLLYELKKILPNLNIQGYENSKYAIKNTHKKIKDKVRYIDNYIDIPISKKKYDLTIAIGVVYSYTLKDAIEIIKVLNNISRTSYITLASYTNIDDYMLFKNWTLLGNLILKKNEWKKLLIKFAFKGDYEFTNSRTLNLKNKL